MDALLEAPAELETQEIEAPEGQESSEQTETPVVTDAQRSETETRTPEQIEADAKLPLWKQAQPELEKIKAENPGLAAKIKDALFRDQQLAKDLPEGIKGAVALRNGLNDFAKQIGVQGDPSQVLGEVKSQMEYFHGLDNLFTNDPANFAVKLNEASPESFQKLALASFGEFSKANPEGYAAYVAQATDAFLEKGGISVEFEVLREFLPLMPDFTGKTRVIAAMEKIFGLTQDLKAMASKPVTAPAKKTDDAAAIAEREQRVAAQELDNIRVSFNNASTPYGNTLMNAEITRLAGKTVVSPQDKQKVTAQVAEELEARLSANKGYGEAMRGFLQAKDAEGYKRRLHSEYQKLIPGAVSRAYSDVVTAKPGKPIAAKPAAEKVTAIRPAGEAGWKTLSKYPVGQVDLSQTTRKMMDEGKYILKDGSKVQYSRRQA